jgi:L-rhamnose mutarotase
MDRSSCFGNKASDAFGRLATFEKQAEWEDFVGQFQVTTPGQRSEEKWQLTERIFALNA